MEKNKNSELVFTTYVTLKNGRKLYARQFGTEEFCFLMNLLNFQEMF